MFTFNTKLDITKQLLCGKAYIRERIKCISNNFWIDVLKSWLYFSELISELTLKAAMEQLFYNTKFLGGKKPFFFYKRWYENKIFVVSDILNEDGYFMDLITFNLINGMRAHFLEYNGLLAQ